LRIAGFFVNHFFSLVVKYAENPLDKAFHVGLPTLLNFEKIHDKIRKIKVRELSFNIIYVLFAMLILLLYMVVIR